MSERPHLTVVDDYKALELAWRSAAEKRHPGINHTAFRDGFSKESLSEYGELNDQLHFAIHGVAVEYFGEQNAENVKDQFLEWYGPSYECHMGVIVRHITLEFLQSLQGLLADNFRDWMIVITPCDDFFDSKTYDKEIIVLSDAVLIAATTARRCALSLEE